MIRLLSPLENETVSILTDIQKTFIAATEKRAAVDGNLTFQWDDLVREGVDSSVPEPVTLRWEGACGATVSLWPADYPEQVTTVTATPDTCEVRVLNLIPETTYVWQVADGPKSTFVTGDGPRFMYVDGTTNVRDLGGWRGRDGKRIRYGKIYRGSELDSHCDLTEHGARTMVEEMNIRTDLDLRGKGEIAALEGKRVLVPYGVDWCHIPEAPYDNIFSEEWHDGYRQIFTLLANPEAYPIYFHCWGGADRGGTLAFMIEALLGVSREELLLDYGLTSLSPWGTRSRNYPPFQKMLATFEEKGDSDLHRGVEVYLKEIGITDEQIATIRTITKDGEDHA